MLRKVIDVVTIIAGAMLIAISFNFFFIPHQLIAGGVSGIVMIVGYFTHGNIGLLYLLSNIPLIIWGLIKIGRKFVLLSILSVVATSWLVQLIPINITQYPLDITISAVFGAVLLGIGSGISLRVGGSTGGFDIAGSILTRNTDFPIGTFLFILNGVVVLTLGYFKNDWNLALYSMLAMFITGRVVDTIHIRHIKLTAFIITQQKEELTHRLLKLPRGVTLIKSEGAYSHQQNDMLMIVISRYELAELKDIIKQCDPKAFVNIVETSAILGEFRRGK